MIIVFSSNKYLGIVVFCKTFILRLEDWLNLLFVKNEIREAREIDKIAQWAEHMPLHTGGLGLILALLGPLSTTRE